MLVYRQETDKSCGVACIRSAMNHLGKNLSEKEVWQIHKSYFPTPENMLNPILNLGNTCLQFGFEVEYFNYHPILINGNKGKNLKESLEIKYKNYYQFGKYYVDQALKFLRKGGKIVFNKLGIDEIKRILDINEFAIVEIKPAFVENNASLDMNHKVILSGYTEKGFKILNPSDSREYIWDYDTFLLSFYSSIPELLVLRRKKR